MNRRILIAAGAALLALALLLLLPVMTPDPSGATEPPGSTAATPGTSMSSSTVTTAPPTSSSAPATVPTTAPTTAPTTVPTTSPTTVPTTAPTEPPTIPTTTPPPPTTTLPPRPGQVRLYTCDVARVDRYVWLAVEYYNATGTEVILMMPQKGESCAQALARFMDSDMPPTVFCIHEEDTLQQYAHCLHDLSGTAVAKERYSDAFGIYDGNALLALPVEVDWFGYIYNTSLLSKVSFSREDFFRSDMTSYNSMAYIRKYITSQQSALGAYPFAKPDLLNTDLAALLSKAFPEPAQLRSFLDLYVGNSRSTTDALDAFLNGKTVFYAGTTASFADVLPLGIAKLELLPAFAKGSSAMQYTCSRFLAVTESAYDPDLEQTLAFLNWMVTAEAGAAAPIDILGGLSPYRDAAVSKNALEKLLRKYMAEEPAQLLWDCSCVAEDDLTSFCEALNNYYLKPNDDTWAAVEALMKKKSA